MLRQVQRLDSIIVRTDPAGRVITLAGDIDLASSPRLGQVISGALVDQLTRLTIDLDDLRFCDCSGLRALIDGRKDADQRHIDYQVTNPHGQVAMVMDVARGPQVPQRAGRTRQHTGSRPH